MTELTNCSEALAYVCVLVKTEGRKGEFIFSRQDHVTVPALKPPPPMPPSSVWNPEYYPI